MSMKAVNYVTSESDAAAPSQNISLVIVKAAAFNENVRPVLSTYRKLLCMNMKAPNGLRVMNRQAKFAEVELDMPFIRHLVSSEGTLDHNGFFAVGGQTTSFVVPAVQASGEVTIAVTEVNMGENVFGVAAGDDGRAIVLGEKHIFEVSSKTKSKVLTIDLQPTTVARSGVLDYHRASQLVIAPSKSTCLDLISLATHKSVLQKSWEPHGENVPTTAYIFKRRTFTDEGEDGVHILTAANDNTELRLWTFQRKTKSFKLQQEILISNSGISGKEKFLLSVTNQEEYITLGSTVSPIVVVLEMHRTSVEALRLTTWKVLQPLLGMSAMVGKVAESLTSKSINYQLSLFTRVADGFFEVVFDANRLAGPSNTAVAKADLVDTWFGKVKNDQQRMGVATSTPHTAVSSSLSGDKAAQRTVSTLTQQVAAAAIRQQAMGFCETLRSMDESIVTLQRKAAEVMRLFQESKSREDAQAIGQKFAVRNRSRLEPRQGSSAITPGAMTTSQKELMVSLRDLTDGLHGRMNQAAQLAVKEVLQRRLRSAVEKASVEIEAGEAPLPNIRGTESGRQFSEGLDSAASDVLRRIREQHDRMKQAMSTSCIASKKSANESSKFLAELRGSLRELRRDMAETKAAFVKAREANTVQAPPASPEELVARATALAEEGKWPEAIVVVLEAADITVLLAFLHSPVCTENMSVITNPKTLPLAAFVSICVQLSYELHFHLGTVPLRVELLYVFYMDWDDALHALKNSADPKDKVIFAMAQKELVGVLTSLELVDDRKDVDRKTKNNIRLLKKLIKSISS